MTALTRIPLLNALSLRPNRDNLFAPFQQAFDNLFDDLYSDLSNGNGKSKSAFPKWDIYRTDDQMVIEIAATGCQPEDINVEVSTAKGQFGDKNGQLLKVSGRVSEEHQLGDSVAYSARELRRSYFERSIFLPVDVRGDPVATMKSGILKLVWDLPKEKKPDPIKKIEIKKLDD